MQVPKRRGEIYRQLKQQTDHYVTKDKLERMKRDLERARAEIRPAAAEVTRTQEMGDLSENAGYHAAKSHLRSLHSRIASLEERIKNAIVIEEGSADGKIRIGSTVTVITDGKFTLTFQILGSQETNPAKGYISHSSPLGNALLGHTAGECVFVKTPVKDIRYDILEVK